jgi:YidC/Oxa1 family membrane protein insertase
MEKDLAETRNNTTITYFTSAEGFDDLTERSESESEIIAQPLKWVSIKQKFFLSSIIAKGSFSGGELATNMNPADSSVVEHARVKLFIPKASLADGTEAYKFYIGPNDYQVIGDVAEDFAKNVYLGWPPVYWINKFVIFPVFHFLTKFISNYGLIIIVLVVLLKLVLAPLSYKSYLSMAKMKVLKPDLDVIKEKHGDDATKVQQEQLKLYQQVGVNPISGCVPVLLQMPILFAMFYLFPASIELRQQPFLWAEDLSTYDSILRLPFIIPFGVGDHISLFTLLMTISTLIYTWQNNQMSNVQGPMKSMSYIMPLIFFFVLNSFSAGLTFYYFVSNLVTFAQQAIIRRFVDDNKIKLILEENRKKNASGTTKKSKFMSKLEDAMKAGEEARKKSEEERKKKK